MSTSIASPVPVRRSGPGAWFDHHIYSLVASLGRMARKPW